MAGRRHTHYAHTSSNRVDKCSLGQPCVVGLAGRRQGRSQGQLAPDHCQVTCNARLLYRPKAAHRASNAVHSACDAMRRGEANRLT